MNHSKSVHTQSITAGQTAIIIANNILGVSILVMPSTLSKIMGTPDGYISLILASIVITFVGLWIVYFGKQYPNQTVFEYGEFLFGKWLNRLFTIVFILYFIFMSSYELRILSEVVHLFLLEKTPGAVIIISMMCISTYLMFGGLSSIARMFTILMPITILVLFFCLTLSLKVFDFHHLRPFLGDGIAPVIQGFSPSFYTFLGIETMFILPAYMKKPEESTKSVVWGVGVTTLIYVFTYIAVIGGLSLEVAKTVAWPTISLIRSFQYTGILFERFDSFLMAVWIMQIFTTFVMYHFLLTQTSKAFGSRQPLRGLFFYIPIIYIIAMLPTNTFAISQLVQYISYLFLFIVIAIPLLITLMHLVKRRKPRHDAHS